MKSCLVLSYGPVPTPEYQTVEGGGLRAWGLAAGLAANGVDVTVGVHESYPQERKVHENIKLCNWSLQGDFVHLVNSFDSVIVSYCQGDLSTSVALGIADNVQLILDAYVPIYVEVSARDSDNLTNEYVAYMEEIERWGTALRRGDYLICANETQKIFYTGVLSALGRLNPITYRQPLIGIVPFGIEDKAIQITEQPFKGDLVPENSLVVMWFGGLYPWFDIGNLVQAVEQLNLNDPRVRLLIVGGRNPFNPNPDFARQYDAAVEYTTLHGLKDKVVFFQDWVDYDKRANWYASADIVVSLNTVGDENRFSWRTRIMDFVWGEVPMATNGGDPLSEYLIEKSGAVRLISTETEGLKDSLDDLLQHPHKLKSLKDRVKELKGEFYWPVITKELAGIIESKDRAQDLVDAPELGAAQDNAQAGSQWRHKVSLRYGHTLPYKALKAAYRLPRFIRTYGKRAAARQAYYMLKSLARHSAPDRQYVFISHPLDQSGGPLVMTEILEEFSSHIKPRHLRIIAPFIDITHMRTLRRLGVSVEMIDGRIGYGAVWSRLNLRKDDFVLMNTSAISPNYRDAIFALLEQGRLNEAIWYVHEDKPELQFGDEKLVARIKSLLIERKLKMAVPSIKMKDKYKAFFDAPIEIIELHVDVNERFKKERPAKDFGKIRFLLSGTATDARKGQPTALLAFSQFFERHYRVKPELYRDFELHFIGLGDDYMSRQLVEMGEAALGNHFKYKTKITRDEALEYTQECNAILCCSLMEAFGLYIAEGMYMGHFIVRNNCSGVHEQLEDGVNGFYLESKDLNKFTATIERILNKDEISNDDLARMGRESQKRIARYATNSYYDQLKKLDQRNSS